MEFVLLSRGGEDQLTLEGCSPLWNRVIYSLSMFECSVFNKFSKLFELYDRLYNLAVGTKGTARG